MFNSITGIVNLKLKDRIYVRTNGIEWAIFTTEKSLLRFPDIGEEVRIFTYLHHRDDQLKIFGFVSDEERDLFFDLLKVEGLGPRLAIKILSGIEVNDFVEALDNDDVESLSAIPGLGKKTAQKIILKLKGKLKLAEKPWGSVEEDIITALAGMGFDRKASRNAVKTALKSIDTNSMSKGRLEKELFTRAISIASGKDG